ncbi:MAG: hypothetical protein V4690_02965 [Patescibacteria group bacterium]
MSVVRMHRGRVVKTRQVINLKLPGTFGAFTADDLGCEFVTQGVRNKLVQNRDQLAGHVLEGKDKGRSFIYQPQLKVSNIVREP